MPQIYPNNNSQKRGNARLPKLFVVELQVGDKVYSAEGRTRQQAKHEAAVQGEYTIKRSSLNLLSSRNMLFA